MKHLTPTKAPTRRRGKARASRLAAVKTLLVKRLEHLDDAGLARVETLLKDSVETQAVAEALVAPGARRLDLRGSGLGRRLDDTERAAMLERVTVDDEDTDWVRSRLCGIVETADLLGVARSTLDNWRREHRALAFAKGVRNFVFPIAQFDGARPIPGLARVRARFRSDEEAWEWLVEHNRMTGDGLPLEHLRAGFVDAVVDAARAQYDFA